jgi:LmbE family N-acetylglucosaminyl deacetylase
MKKHILFLFLLLTNTLWSQAPQKLNAVEIYEQVQKLNFLGKVLYVAAHPDDENTKLITYFSNHYHAQTAYLSLTRGDGGQRPSERKHPNVIKKATRLQSFAP